MSILALYGAQDSPGKHDATTVFGPIADALVRIHGGRSVPIDLGRSKPKRFDRVLEEIENAKKELSEKFDGVAICDHGIPSGMPRLGLTKGNLVELSHVLAPISSKLRVMLYACSTGATSKKGPADGDGSYADLLRDELCVQGASFCSVMGHTLAGHALWMPFVRLFEGAGSPTGGHGGSWVVSPKSRLFPAWRGFLKTSDLAYRFPFMPLFEIHQELT